MVVLHWGQVIVEHLIRGKERGEQPQYLIVCDLQYDWFSQCDLQCDLQCEPQFSVTCNMNRSAV